MIIRKKRGNFKIREIALKALDMLALALTNHHHKWINSERKLYENAVKNLA
jgi:hypothetical protein